MYLLMCDRLHLSAILYRWLRGPLLPKTCLWCLVVSWSELLVQAIRLLGVLDGSQDLRVDELLSILLDVDVWLTAAPCSQLNFLHSLAICLLVISQWVGLAVTDLLLTGIVYVDVVFLGGALRPMLVEVSQCILMWLFRGAVNGSMVVMLMVVFCPISFSRTSMLILHVTFLKLALFATTTGGLPSVFMRGGGSWGYMARHVCNIALSPVIRIALSTLNLRWNDNCLLLGAG